MRDNGDEERGRRRSGIGVRCADCVCLLSSTVPLACALRKPQKEGKRMATEPTIREPLDKKVINMTQPDEVGWWCKELGCTPERLQTIVHEVGNSVTVIRRALAKVKQLN
jgi:hypothetical protein